MLSGFSVELPLAGLARFDGLVRRTVGRVTMERMDAGTGIGRAEPEIPKQADPFRSRRPLRGEEKPPEVALRGF